MKLYSQKQIVLGSVLGGPLNGAFLLFENFRNLNDIQKGATALLSGFTLLVAYLFIAYSIPERYTNGLGFVFEALNAGIATLAFTNFMKTEVDQHEANKLPFYSNWRVAGITAVNVGLFIAVLYVFFQFNTTPFDAELYDQKIAQFEQNEEIAVSTFSLLDSVSNEGILIYINQKAMPALQHNEELVKELNYIQFLPQELIDQNALLSQINFKRKESLQLMQDYLISGVDNIDAFNQKQEEIDALIEQVNNLY